MAEKRLAITSLEIDLHLENERLRMELKKKDARIQELQKKLNLQMEHNFTITSRLAAMSQAEKERDCKLEQKIHDLTMEKNEMMETIEKLEKEKKPFFSFK